MGFLDKEKGLAGRLSRAGEEVVRVVDYDKVPEKQKPEKKAPAPKPEKAPRRKFSDLISSGKNKVVTQYEEEEPEDEELQKTVEEDLPIAYKVATDTAFDLDEDEPYFSGNNSVEIDFEDLPESSETAVPDSGEVEYNEDKIKDVLEILRIPATFLIAPDVLMPDDFKKIDFDLQVPQGYDIGQVEFFVERAESTIKEYLSLLEQRNEHVALLATTVDRLQVDLENLKFDSQIAAGIGIMPTSDNDELERDNLELRLQVKRLEDALASKTKMPDLSSKERELYESLRNEFSILKREKDTLEQENSDLRSELARIEEEQDDPTWMAGQQSGAALPSFDLEDDSPSQDFGGIEYMDELPSASLSSAELPALDFGNDSSTPHYEDDLDEELPSLGAELPSVLPSPPVNSSYDFDLSEDDSKPASINEDDDDEDDELAKLMKGWS